MVAGGVVVIEVVFNYPGLGRLMIDSISDRDLPVVQSIALIVASVYVCVNLAADLLYVGQSKVAYNVYEEMMTSVVHQNLRAGAARLALSRIWCHDHLVRSDFH